jgi:UDP-2-acetamido-2,6-beta-L-arabino-hexul-4-ose reductase
VERIKVLVTGSDGFIGKNLLEALNHLDNLEIYKYDINDSEAALEKYLQVADVIYHLAGVNRPEIEKEFEDGNVNFTRSIVNSLQKHNKTPIIVMTSSIQAELGNPYGTSKKKAEDILIDYSKSSGTRLCIYRLPNVFGKWSRPNYNSVVATFCYNISHGLDITISDPDKVLELVYIDDVVKCFVGLLKCDKFENGQYFYNINRTYKITLEELARKIHQFKGIKEISIIPDYSDLLTKYLYATYLSFLDKNDFSYVVERKTDNRGWLSELIKSNQSGQIFVSSSHPGIIRGNHYHNTKTEKFIVIKGTAIIRFRHIMSKEIIEYKVSGDKIEIVDIPPGYTHSIENIGDDELIVLFWADELFDPENPDTYRCEVNI